MLPGQSRSWPAACTVAVFKAAFILLIPLPINCNFYETCIVLSAHVPAVRVPPNESFSIPSQSHTHTPWDTGTPEFASIFRDAF